MAKTITISPVTRINGFWRLDVEVEADRVIRAKSSGIYVRGMEAILRNRDPRDAVYLTQRICGICSSVHAMAGSLALEQAYNLEIPRNAVILRNLIFGADLLQNHIRHFYFLTLPDFVEGPEEPPFVPRYKGDYRLSRAESEGVYENFRASIDMSRYAHEMLTIFGGKAPHNHGILIGGGSVHPTADNVRLFLARLEAVQSFIDNRMLPDIQLIADKYPEYYQIGKGPERFITYGMFPREDKQGEFYFKPGTVINNQINELQPANIQEMVKHSWYKDTDSAADVMQSTTNLDPDKEGAYSWIKAPRYEGFSMQTGPLPRLWVTGEYRRGISAMDRYMARILEAQKVAKLMQEWAHLLEPGMPIYTPHEPPRSARGIGLVGAMRGGLGHWVEVDNYHVKRYQVITPSAWNMSPRDDRDEPGPVEEALVGTPVADVENPIEIGRVARSFDPCSSCAAQVYTPDGSVREYRI